MPDNRPISELVDELLVEPKELVGSIQHRLSNRGREQVRLEWPVLVRGQSAQCAVACTLYPNAEDWRFTICLIFRNLNIWRLDFEPEDRIERNPLLPGHTYSGAEIRGPHCHRWKENSRYATRNALPDEHPHVLCQVGIGIEQRLVLADHAAELGSQCPHPFVGGLGQCGNTRQDWQQDDDSDGRRGRRQLSGS